MVVVYPEDVINAIKEKYDDSDSGCSFNGVWFSPARIIQLIEKVADDYGFEER